ncbi:MAG TPA: hypothetical protein VFK57_17160 [Vicinamibacterales bacterium]|nr:hypothetical protein [Vicinamibacterales bacterium]
MAVTPDGGAVREVVAHAAALRDRSARHRRTWRAAPVVAALLLAIAVGGRLFGWPALVTFACGAGFAAVLAAYALLPRRGAHVSDQQAAALDARAALGGELRSAHWFAGQPATDAWVSYHLSRAAERIAATPWPTLYALQRMPRRYGVTAALAIAAAIVAFIGPSTPAAVAPGIQVNGPAGRGRPLTAAEIERQLAALLATLEFADASNARPATPEEIRKLLDAVRESQRQNAGRGAAIDEELRKRLERAAQKDALDPEVREALQDLEKALAASRDQTAKTEKPAGQTADQSGAPQGDAAKANQTGGQQDAAGQIRSDSQPGAGFGIVAMANEPGGQPRDPGLGLGGGDGGSPNSGVMADLRAALRRETVESGAGAAAGDPVTDLRHKTDRGTASVGFSGGAAAATERGRANVVPVIPEARRPAARAYFQRKR